MRTNKVYSVIDTGCPDEATNREQEDDPGIDQESQFSVVGEGLKRDAVEALARGERLVRPNTGMDTVRINHINAPVAAAG
jgi:hypothetical protein